MGAPTGHPFFGNQYTDGGYVLGSFSYENVLQDVLEAAAEASPRTLVSKTANKSSYARLVNAPIAGAPTGSIASLVAVGAAVVLGGVAAFVYLRGRSRIAGDQVPDGDDIAGFGLCESCGEELAVSGSAKVEQDDEGTFAICEVCSHKNRARYTSDGEAGVSAGQ